MEREKGASRVMHYTNNRLEGKWPKVGIATGV